MKCGDYIAGHCGKAIKYKKYAEVRRCNKCCLECKFRCDEVCEKALEEQC